MGGHRRCIRCTTTTRHLVRWRDHLGPATFVVRTFEPERFLRGSLVADFLDAAGLEVDKSQLAPAERRNESLCAEAVEVLRLLNLHRVENEGARAGLIINRDLIQRLQGVAGPTLTLPAAALNRFQDRWEASNQAVAREFLADPDGVLFRSTRRDDGTTTEQILDPARLDHYLEILEVPEQQHVPLRQIAQREAMTAASASCGVIHGRRDHPDRHSPARRHPASSASARPARRPSSTPCG